MPDIFDELDTVDSTPKKDIFDELEPTPTARVSTGALGTRFRPSVRTNVLGGPSVPPTESVLGIKPEDIPSGANTTAPWITIPLSVAGKTAAGVAGYLTSPQGATEAALAATPAAPVIFAKWAYDMAKGGYRSVKGIVDEVGQMANEALNRGIISANQLGPIPEGKSTQEHIQSLAENAANAALMGLGAVGAAAHVKLPTKEVPVVPEAKPASQEAIPEVKPTEVKEPPAVAPEGAPPTAPATVAAKAGEEAPSPTGPAIPETATPEPSPQGVSVTDKVTPDVGPGMGGALKEGEIPETGAGGEKYGVAERVRAERAQAGQVEPVAPGEGTTPQKTIALGREIIRKDPEAGTRIMEQFESDPEKRTSETGIAVVRAHGESLAAGARTIEETYGTESPEYKAAKEVLSDWDRRSKAMQTQWHRQGQAQQGETDIDTASYSGLERARQQTTGKDIPTEQKPRAKKIAKENKQAQNDLRVASNTLNKAILTKSVSNPVQAALDAASKTVREHSERLADAENKARVAAVKLENETSGVRTDAEKKALDAAHKTVREAAIRLAEAQNKSRVAKTVREKKIADDQAKQEQRAIDAANKTIRENAARSADKETKSRIVEAQRQKEIAELEAKRTKKALDAAKNLEDQARQRAVKEAQRRANDPSIAVWEKAKEILDENKGLYSFDDLRNKLAAELNMSTSKIAGILARDSTVKRLASDVLVKQRNARRLKEQAKIWLRELDTPGYLKALNTIPRSMFSLSVFGHGFVALGTHAPIVAFQPRFWGAYVKNFGKMYHMVFSPAYYEMQMQDLVRRPNYDLARDAGLQNDPFKYEEFHTTMVRDLVKNWIGEKNMNRVDTLAGAGNRGYGVLKLLRQDMFDQAYDRMPRNIRVQKGVAEGLADGINHATGVTQKQGFKGSNILFFAPRLEASRVAWLTTDMGRAVGAVLNWEKATTAQREFAKAQFREKGWVLGTFASLLAMNQGFLAATGSKQKINGIPEALGGAGIDPLAGDFLKFKVAGMNVAYGGALLTMAKLPARIGWAIAYEGKGSKFVLEDERAFKVVGSYIRSQMSPFAGTLSDLAFGRDYEERPLPRKLFGTIEQTEQVPKRLQNIGVDEPYTWTEFAATRLPIPVAEAFKEGMRGSGMNDNQVAEWMKAIGLGIAMTGTGTRITEDTREE